MKKLCTLLALSCLGFNSTAEAQSSFTHGMGITTFGNLNIAIPTVNYMPRIHLTNNYNSSLTLTSYVGLGIAASGGGGSSFNSRTGWAGGSTNNVSVPFMLGGYEAIMFSYNRGMFSTPDAYEERGWHIGIGGVSTQIYAPAYKEFIISYGPAMEIGYLFYFRQITAFGIRILGGYMMSSEEMTRGLSFGIGATYPFGLTRM